MADIEIEIETVKSQCAAFVATEKRVVGDLNGLRSQVSSLLTSKGGLYLRASSPAFDAAYSKFNIDLTKAVENIEQFTSGWTQLVDQLDTMDKDMASKINTGK